MIKILVADDESRIINLLSAFLKKEGYEVVTASNGREALQKFYSDSQIKLAILDVMMPFMSGYSVCKRIKRKANIPVIILTAKSEERDQIDAFDSGADDYVSKPFSCPVLMKRVAALLKRNKKVEGTLVYKELSVNFLSHQIIAEGKDVVLTPKEFKILKFLCKNMGLIMSRQQIINYINSDGAYFCEERNVDTHIKNLRIKLGEVCGSYIKTVRGIGYKIDLLPQGEESL